MTKTDYIAEALTAHWGERCSDNQPGCPCCDAWAQYDAIREAALREAAAVCLAVSVDPLTQAGREHAPWMKATAEDCSRAILALVEKPDAR